MNKRKIFSIKYVKWLFAAVILLPVLVFAINAWNEGYRVDHGDNTVEVYVGNSDGTKSTGVCYKVTNKNNVDDYFIPTKTTKEWEAFSNNLPDGVTIGPCCTPQDGEWSEWGECGNAVCKNGIWTGTTTRTCSNPEPSCGGEDCSGNNSRVCFLSNSLGWGPWSECSAPCGGGTQTRTCLKCDGSTCRSTFGGFYRSGKVETLSCNTQACCTVPINGGWGPWSACSGACEGGRGTQTRTCTNPVPSCGGTDCVGPNTQDCVNNAYCCPAKTSGKWGWSAYLPKCGRKFLGYCGQMGPACPTLDTVCETHSGYYIVNAIAGTMTNIYEYCISGPGDISRDL